jgi:aryl-alcohol dehydrogenase-like predicted oxidoreductase
MGLWPAWTALANGGDCTPAQLALAWLLSQGDHVHAIPGTTSVAHLEDDMGAATLAPEPALLRAADEMINPDTVRGARYNDATQAEIDTEELANDSTQDAE